MIYNNGTNCLEEESTETIIINLTELFNEKKRLNQTIESFTIRIEEIQALLTNAESQGWIPPEE